jgi:tetratricopeptide (TPR) repeat protein
MKRIQMALPQDSYEAHELQWQLYTKAGNQRMQAKLYHEAQQAYDRALVLAERLLEKARNKATHPDAIHPYVVSCHNLADCYLTLGNAQQAEIILRQAFDRIIGMMTDEGSPNPHKLEAFKALKAVSFKINSFYRKLDQVTQAEEFFERSIVLAQNFLAHFEFPPTVNLADLQNHSNER